VFLRVLSLGVSASGEIVSELTRLLLFFDEAIVKQSRQFAENPVAKSG